METMEKVEGRRGIIPAMKTTFGRGQAHRVRSRVRVAHMDREVETLTTKEEASVAEVTKAVAAVGSTAAEVVKAKDVISGAEEEPVQVPRVVVVEGVVVVAALVVITTSRSMT